MSSSGGPFRVIHEGIGGAVSNVVAGKLNVSNEIFNPISDKNRLVDNSVFNNNIDIDRNSSELQIQLSENLIEATFSPHRHSAMPTTQGRGANLHWPSVANLLRDLVSGSSDINDRKLRALAIELAKLLPANVLRALEGVPHGQTISLKLAQELETIPWEWIEVSGSLLTVAHPVIRAVRVSDKARGYPSIVPPMRILLIGDTLPEQAPPLPHSLTEVHEIAAIYQELAEVRLLLQREATFENIANYLRMARFDVIHYAGHAWFDELEPYLLLNGDVKLHATDLMSLLSGGPPAILFLNTHYSVFVPPGARKENAARISSNDADVRVQGHRGFVDAASVSGVGALIGSFIGSLNDRSAKQIGVAFHKLLVEGKPAALALHEAVVNSPSEQGDISRFSYSISGYGSMTIPKPQPKPSS